MPRSNERCGESIYVDARDEMDSEYELDLYCELEVEHVGEHRAKIQWKNHEEAL